MTFYALYKQGSTKLIDTVNILFGNVSFENDKNSKRFLLVKNTFLTLKDLSSKFIY
jgi:hypothetical protein